MIHIKNLVLNINIETPTSILGKTSEQQSDEYRKRIQVEDDMKANIISRMIYRQRLADWARSRFGDDVANTILGGGY
ncbi:hypothetical protein C4K03_4175 [Pseudomonas synxantha]|uniref:Uncharacterized protein n=1 Tax=Pseudomonas synxantha TaxID=47883 RepID=A0A3G7UCG6_9PSED|nr:hypothetical protein [Pseudomonas synxantha]AZE56322.1 hypothetical protein C4K03_4175 [Pseudomonas synxantha]